jgi:hypothetical protein
MGTTRDGDATVSPPAGMGSVPGLGEAFRMNLNTGQGVYSYTLVLPGGVAGHTPKVVLEYSQGTRLGPFGFGWQLGVRSVDVRLDLGIPGDAPTTFLDNGSEIVPLVWSADRDGVRAVFPRGGRLEDRRARRHRLPAGHRAGCEDRRSRAAKPRSKLAPRELDRCVRKRRQIHVGCCRRHPILARSGLCRLRCPVCLRESA